MHNVYPFVTQTYHKLKTLVSHLDPERDEESVEEAYEAIDCIVRDGIGFYSHNDWMVQASYLLLLTFIQQVHDAPVKEPARRQRLFCHCYRAVFFVASEELLHCRQSSDGKLAFSFAIQLLELLVQHLPEQCSVFFSLSHVRIAVFCIRSQE